MNNIYTYSGNCIPRVPSGIQHIKIAIDSPLEISPYEFYEGESIGSSMPEPRYLELNRYICSIHLSYEMLYNHNICNLLN